MTDPIGDVDGWHWVQKRIGPDCCFWISDYRTWFHLDGFEDAPKDMLRKFPKAQYLGPALLPAQVTAKCDAARREGAEAMLASALDALEQYALTHIIDDESTSDEFHGARCAISALPLPEMGMTKTKPVDPKDIAVAIHVGDWGVRRPITAKDVERLGAHALKEYHGEVQNVISVLRDAGVEILGDVQND